MTTDYRQPELRTLTHDELVSEAPARFGNDALRWAFQCPVCGDVAQVGEFPDQGRHPGQYCIGNFVAGRGCDYKAFGLIPGPWTVTMESGSPVASFPLAPAPC